MKKFTWNKIGNIFNPEGEYPWMNSHAANPFPVLIGDSIVRVYFTSRDIQNRSHIAFVDLSVDDNFNVVDMSAEPLLAPGPAGQFDDSGVAMGWYLENAGKKFIYYLGWNLKVTVPWQNSIGLALDSDGSGNFIKFSRAPIVDRSNEDPFSISYPAILFEGNKFRMWYGSNLTWGTDQREMNHVIKYAESTNGINWQRSDKICIGLNGPLEYAVSKPFVLKIDNMYCMWYSFRASERAQEYRIGFAHSPDGLHWQREDSHAGIEVSSNGWDSEMICYASVIKIKSLYYMFYNGNGFGKTGFGIATAQLS